MVRTIAVSLFTVAVLVATSLPALSVDKDTQGHMEAAKKSIEQAQRELQAASPNKGGHREKALEYLKSALDQVQAGIYYANHEEQQDKNKMKPGSTMQH